MKKLLITALLFSGVGFAKESTQTNSLDYQTLIKEKKYKQAFKKLTEEADKNDLAKVVFIDYNMQCISYYADYKTHMRDFIGNKDKVNMCRALSSIYPHKSGYINGVAGMYNSALKYTKMLENSSNKKMLQIAHFDHANLLSIKTTNYLVHKQIKVDYEQAIENYKKALELNAIKDITNNSALRLAYLYANGLGTLQDASSAEKYYNIAISNGSIVAKCALGELYIKEKKISKAKEILKEGYKEGAKVCGKIWKQYNLGM